MIEYMAGSSRQDSRGEAVFEEGAVGAVDKGEGEGVWERMQFSFWGNCVWE